MRLRRHATCPVLILLAASLVLAEKPAAVGDGRPMTEAAYREAASRWHAIWTERPSVNLRNEDACIAAWQTGERVRLMVRAATPPPPHAAYHAALLDCIAASLAVSDECLLKPHGGPKWMPYRLAARKKCLEVATITNRGKLDLPRSW